MEKKTEIGREMEMVSEMETEKENGGETKMGREKLMGSQLETEMKW